MRVERFHVASGPESLFQRVQQVFDSPRRLKLHAPHLVTRAGQRAAPLEALETFNAADWELMLVEARTDTGKFVSTTWRRKLQGEYWWVVIGFHDTVRTVYPTDATKRAHGDAIVTDGPVWHHVQAVNRRLLQVDG